MILPTQEFIIKFREGSSDQEYNIIKRLFQWVLYLFFMRLERFGFNSKGALQFLTHF